MKTEEVCADLAKNKKNSKSVSMRKYKNRQEFNIGIFLFLIVLIYLIVTVILYMTSDTISVYEVREGSIVKDNSYTGLILREETEVDADASGYISFYPNENSKVKNGSNIYALTSKVLDTTVTSDNSSEDASSDTTSTNTELNQEVQSGITLQIQNFNNNYKATDFSSVYSLRNEVNSYLQATYSKTRTEHLDAVIEASGQKAEIYEAAQDGIFTQSVDGYENVTKDTFTKEMFDKTNYQKKELKDQTKVSTGDPVYRMITSENWSVIIPLEDETAKLLKQNETTSVQVRIDKDSEKMWADFSLIQKDGAYYGCLDFDNSMVRYASERYLNVELILEDQTGLKIPKSAVVEEDFYVFPQEYLTTGGNSTSLGVMIQDRKGNASFQALDIYNTSDDGTVYVSKDQLKNGYIIAMPDSTETYKIGDTKKLKGVYNINKGYAVFKKITILCENDEYYVVQEGESYGLYNYDHIAQNGKGISSDEVVFQ